MIVVEQDRQAVPSLCQFKTGESLYILFGKINNIVSLDKRWLDPQYHSDGLIKKPGDLENDMQNPPMTVDETKLDQIQGSLIGMAIGDALGAHVEFRPHQYLLENPVKDLEGGGTWGLKKGQVCYHHCISHKRKFKRGFMKSFLNTSRHS